MQIEVKLESNPISDFDGPWGRGHPRVATQKAKIKKFNMLTVLLPIFTALALILTEEIAGKKGHCRIVARRIIRIRITRAAFATANTKMPQRSLNDLEI